MVDTVLDAVVGEAVGRLSEGCIVRLCSEAVQLLCGNTVGNGVQSDLDYPPFMFQLG